MQRFVIFFITVNALHFSGGFFAHHQELEAVHIVSGVCQTGLLLLLVVAASKLDMYPMLCVRFWVPDDGRGGAWDMWSNREILWNDASCWLYLKSTCTVTWRLKIKVYHGLYYAAPTSFLVCCKSQWAINSNNRVLHYESIEWNLWLSVSSWKSLIKE
jgi:hypothetical protein